MNLGPDFSTQTLALGDVHVQADTLSELLEYIESLPRTRRTREKIFLGDLVDRGPDSGLA
ncbi:metallophosphoesterase [Roseovarius sp. THAF27]|uniref:metallophosphoesterase n=1 Tax=Roseovarius sp. THAF27 TaxID=2587850 RepID=UPI0012687641